MVCNADEGDPGAFVNRILMESDPHLTIEGMLIGAVATGASKGFIYIRDEYPMAVARMRKAVEQGYERGLLGENILGSSFSCDMEVVRGAGAYVCGEETGLIASISDYRGMPRIKPPFPAAAGVFMLPTNVNNVESYASAPMIIMNGAEWYSSVGTERAKGTKILSLSGDCARVCILESDVGISLRTVFEQAGGGMRDPRHPLKAVQPGGPLMFFIPASLLDITLEPASFVAEGIAMGSGGFVFMDDRNCVVEFARRLMQFNGDESCGRCTTCRAGNMRFADIMDRICSGRGIPQDIETIRQYASFMVNGNCAHGQLSPNPLNGSLKFFLDEYLEHINERRCAAGACHEMQEYVVNPERQAEAAAIADVCPTNAIVTEGSRTIIRQDRCIKCGLCAEAAPRAILKGSPRAEQPAEVMAR
jgi:NADH:ubiquinone oxidoreductase subunit F (NADH-binding)